MEDNNVFCPKPFNTIYNHPGRSYSPCCWGVPQSKETANTVMPLDYFKGEEFSRLRRDMLAGKMTDYLRDACQLCYKREADVGYSPRTQLKPLPQKALEAFNSDGSMKETSSRFISIAINVFGNSCNLQCYTCDPMESTSRKRGIDLIQSDLDKIGITEDKISEGPNYRNLCFDHNNEELLDRVINHLADNHHNIRNIELVGGEPMLMKPHFKLLDRLIQNQSSKEINLSYISNMTLMKLDKIKHYFDNFQYTDIKWSVDALKERNHWIRFPTNWEVATKNVFDVQTYFKKNKNGHIIGSITPSLLGIATLKQTYSWLLVRNLINKEMVIFNNVVKPSFLRTRNLPDPIKEKISHEVSLISDRHYRDLIKPRNQHEFELAVKYFDLLDKSRGTDWRSTFPEIAKYAN